MSYFEIVILYALSQRPGHGYEIRRRLAPVLGGGSLNPNVLYPALRRFEEMGAVVKTVESQSGRPARHVYHLTEQGEEILHTSLIEFPPEKARSATEFETRVSFFALLHRNERLQIVEGRERQLSLEITHMSKNRKRAQTAFLGQWAIEVLDHTLRQLRAELRWVKRLRARIEQYPAT